MHRELHLQIQVHTNKGIRGQPRLLVLPNDPVNDRRVYESTQDQHE
jgi:hypothetical protein